MSQCHTVALYSCRECVRAVSYPCLLCLGVELMVLPASEIVWVAFSWKHTTGVTEPSLVSPVHFLILED